MQRPPPPGWQPYWQKPPMGFPPPAQAPYDPRYVGPHWAAPGPYRQLPPPKRSSGSGCLIAALVVGGLLFVFVVLPLAVVVAIGSAEGDEDPDRDYGPPTGVTTGVPVTQLGTTESAGVKKARSTGVCSEVTNERWGTTYEARRDDGSAPRLRGKVAILHVRLGGGAAAWPKSLQSRVDEAAITQGAFYRAEARARGIPLEVDMFPWSLADAPVSMPTLTIDSHQSLDLATQRLLKVRAREGIQMSVAEPLESVVADFKRKGYDSVAILTYFPQSTQARNFAWYASSSDPKNDPEIAIVFPRKDELTHLSVTVAHEGLHLFGAYDLYRLKRVGPDDRHDIMGEYCTGLKQARIGDATAYGIGWTDDKPDRPYTIVDR
ncbi:MAG: hypothetical protein JNL38_13690 [Myxococcales bacterium]|jgi:hypothetical protein|nr:hypothetical protein [Myxococcales bacterium]